MIYWYNKNIDQPGLECSKKIFVFNKEDNEAAVTTTDVFNNKNYFEKLKLKSDIKIAMFVGTPVPVFVVNDATAGGDLTAVSKLIFSKLDELNGDIKSEAAKTLIEKLINVLTNQLQDREIAKDIVYSFCIQYTWEHSGALQHEFVVDVADYDPDFRMYTVNALAEINDKFTRAINSIRSVDNNTVFQESCTDKLFIEIPSRQMLLNTESLYELVPKFDEVCKPYADKAAYSVNYKSLLAGNSSILRDIEGDRAHNTFEIFDNEKEYYTALDEWVRFNMKEQYGSAEGNIIDLESQQYLSELIAMFYMLHWRHCENVPDSIDDNIDEDVDCVDRYIFSNKEAKTNAVIILNEFLKEASAEFGYEVYLKALIQISRWGARKPTALIFEGMSREFDLSFGMLRNRVGDINSYSVVPQNGKESKFAGIIVENKLFKDATVGISNSELPVGVITETQMADKDGNEIQLLMYYHMIDFLPAVKEGKISVDGVRFENGRWAVDAGPGELYTELVNELVYLYNQSKNDVLQFPFYRSQQLIDLFTKTNRNTTGMLQSLLTIMNSRMSDPAMMSKAASANFVNYDDVLELVADNRNALSSTSAVIEYSIIKSIIPVYQKVVKFEMDSVTDMLNAWEQAMRDYSGLPVYGEKTVTTEQPVVSPVSSTTPVRVNSFESTSSIDKEEVKKVQTTDDSKSNPSVSDVWFRVVPVDTVVYPIKTNDTIIGHCMVESGVPGATPNSKPYTRYTVVSDTKERKVDESRAVDVSRIMALVLHNIYLSTTGSTLRQVFFEDSDALNNLKIALNQLSKK